MERLDHIKEILIESHDETLTVIRENHQRVATLVDWAINDIKKLTDKIDLLISKLGDDDEDK